MTDPEKRMLDVLAVIAKYLGAIDRQVSMQTRMLAADRGLKVIYHDPSLEPWPASTAKHGEAAELPETIHLGLPYHLRASKTETQA